MSRAYLLQPAARLIAAALQQIIALANGSTATTQSATDNSDKIATTRWAWSLPAIQQIPDGTAAGGNARGTNAVDWQSSRTAATQVASGPGATISGGTNNVASGTASMVGGGDANQALTVGCVVSGGRGNVASGVDSWVPGSFRATTRGAPGCGAWSGSGSFVVQGDAQTREHVLRRQTTDATSTRLTSDGAAAGSVNTVNLPDNSVFSGRLILSARASDGSGKFAYEVPFMLRRDTGAASTLVSLGTPTTLTAGTNGSWAVSVGADTTNGGLAVSVAGEAGKTIKWVARVSTVEVVG